MSVDVERMDYGLQHVHHQYEDIEQQNESYTVGMWTFLVTEIMFFGALFLALTVYRNAYSEDFHQAHEKLDVALGATNTVILLTSSLFAALAVRAGMVGSRIATQVFLGLTILCAFGFLGVKYVEYSKEIVEEHLLPGPMFDFNYADKEQAKAPPGTSGDLRSGSAAALSMSGNRVSPFTSGDSKSPFYGTGAGSYRVQPLMQNRKQLFFSLYFIMTGLHGIHVLIGIVLMGVLFFMIKFRHPAINDYMPLEMTGLYWHFVDIVWIFLFPLIYLVGNH